MRTIASLIAIISTSSALANEHFPLIIEPLSGVLYVAEGEPSLSIISSSNIGTKKATLTAMLDKEAATEWCDAFRPGNKDCINNTISSSKFIATANCEIGEITDLNGEKYKFDNMNRDDNNFHLFNDINGNNTPLYRYVNLQWQKLCPAGRPYNHQPFNLGFTVADNDIVYQSETIGIKLNNAEDLTGVESTSENSIWLNDKLIFRGMHLFNDNGDGSQDITFTGIFINEKAGCQPIGTFATSQMIKNIANFTTKKVVFKTDSCVVEKLLDHSITVTYLH